VGITLLNAREIQKSPNENTLLALERIKISDGDIHKNVTNNAVFLITASRRQISDKIIKIIVVPRNKQ
jgi:hypothetical protein